MSSVTSWQLAENVKRSVLGLSRKQYFVFASIIKKQAFDELVVSAAIVQSPATDSKLDEPMILLLDRNTDEGYYPDFFEVPNGKVEDTDSSIGDALRRKVREETGLTVTRVLDMLPDFEYATGKAVLKRKRDEEMVEKSCVQLNFIVEVTSVDFRPDPADHSSGVWTSKDMLSQLKMTDDMRSLAYLAIYRDADCRRRHGLM